MDDTPTAVAGFRFAGVSCGIKKDGAADLGLVAADRPVACAAMFTKNLVQAAPVVLARERVERGRAQALLVNSGNANACTGTRGAAAARSTTAEVARALGIETDLVVPASTGAIGEPLDAQAIEQAVPALVEDLSPDGAGRFAEAIRTTDRWPKMATRRFAVGREAEVTLFGVAKGAGMIHPDMATTLAFVLTDAPVSSGALASALRHAVDRSFNALTVDGETSTNDTIALLASGQVPMEPISKGEPAERNFREALEALLAELGESIVRDGEGAERVVRLEVRGAPSGDAARMVARRVASSLLVKTAIHGCDPNWGRLLSAAGCAGVAFDPTKVTIRFGDVVVVEAGLPMGTMADAAAREIMRRDRYTLGLDLGAGDGQAHYLFCDIGAEYVRINASYRT